jgi:hypothetical protein
MARIIVQSTGDTNDLSDGFVRAAKLLSDGGIKLCTGTKLVSRYAVIVVEDRQVRSAIECLRAGDVPAVLDA